MTADVLLGYADWLYRKGFRGYASFDRIWKNGVIYARRLGFDNT